MQRLLIGLIILGSMNAFAKVNHVEPNDSIELIPQGSKVTFIKDFNVKPRLREHKLSESKSYACFLYLHQDGVSGSDRVISAGRSFEVEYFGMAYPRFNLPKEEKAQTIYCKSRIGKEKENQMTVAEFVDAIADTLVLKMSDPHEF